MRVLLLVLPFVVAERIRIVSAIHVPEPRIPLVARYIHQKTIHPVKHDLLSMATKIRNSFADVERSSSCSSGYVKPTELRGGGTKAAPAEVEGKKFCGNLLATAYTAAGLATTAAWSTIVYTTIRSNQPTGAMMPTWQHGFFARIGAASAIPLIGSIFYVLASSAKSATSWDDMASSVTCRRHNLALATAGVGSALWTGFAPILTRIPGSGPPVLSHQAYKGVMRAGLIGCYTSAAALCGGVWIRSLPDDVRRNPFQWPGRITDGVSKSLVSLGPARKDDPVNVKYALLTSFFLVFTGLQLGSHPLSVIPSWTGRRLARAFPAWTLLGATTAFDLKESTEAGTLFSSSSSRTLSNGLKGFGSVYLAARCGAVLGDPSWPHSYHAVIQVPAWATAAIFMIGLTLRSDEREAKYYVK